MCDLRAEPEPVIAKDQIANGVQRALAFSASQDAKHVCVAHIFGCSSRITGQGREPFANGKSIRSGKKCGLPRLTEYVDCRCKRCQSRAGGESRGEPIAPFTFIQQIDCLISLGRPRNLRQYGVSSPHRPVKSGYLRRLMCPEKLSLRRYLRAEQWPTTDRLRGR